MVSFTYAIEHMEETSQSDVNVPEWVQLEYKHMRKLAGKTSIVVYTSLPQATVGSLTASLYDPSNDLANFSVHSERILDLTRDKTTIDKICLLDPKADKELSPEDGDGRFQYFLFGGILGDDPPRDRTGELRTLGFPTRRLGPVQMTTDTALGVTKLVVEDKINLDEISYIDFPTLTFNAHESIEMPFRYISENGQPILPPGMRELIYNDLDKGLEF